VALSRLAVELTGGILFLGDTISEGVMGIYTQPTLVITPTLDENGSPIVLLMVVELEGLLITAGTEEQAISLLPHAVEAWTRIHTEGKFLH
jgi:hypothetical protein